MTLSDLSSIGSFISGIGVIVSLIYLGYQTRQSTLSHRAAAYQGRMDYIRGQIASFDPELTSLMLRVHQEDETLTDMECMRFHLSRRSLSASTISSGCMTPRSSMTMLSRRTAFS